MRNRDCFWHNPNQQDSCHFFDSIFIPIDHNSHADAATFYFIRFSEVVERAKYLAQRFR